MEALHTAQLRSNQRTTSRQWTETGRAIRYYSYVRKTKAARLRRLLYLLKNHNRRVVINWETNARRQQLFHKPIQHHIIIIINRSIIYLVYPVTKIVASWKCKLIDHQDAPQSVDKVPQEEQKKLERKTNEPSCLTPRMDRQER